MAPDRRFTVEPLVRPGAQARGLEVVERKGLGHPDTICDAIAERLAVDLCAAYRAHTGHVRHFNVDKSLLAAGRVERRYGGGRVLAPMKLIIGDRADSGVPVAAIAAEAARRWLREHLPLADPERHLDCQVEIRPTSPELDAIYRSEAALLAANDTSAAVGYWPLTPVERLVLDLERWLNGSAFKAAHPESGVDVKVLAARSGDRVDVTIAMPILDRYVADEADYFSRKAAMLAHIWAELDARASRAFKLAVTLNALDAPGRGLEGMYLSVLGTSAEDGDSGQVGRGNRVNGVIAVARPSSAEAVCGKNPLSHPGKVYGALAHALARRLVEEVAGVAEAEVWLCSRIGAPLDRPSLAAARILPAPGMHLSRLRAPVQAVMADAFDGLAAFIAELEAGRVRLY